jgi:hypothetical protein
MEFISVHTHPMAYDNWIKGQIVEMC